MKHCADCDYWTWTRLGCRIVWNVAYTDEACEYFHAREPDCGGCNVLQAMRGHEGEQDIRIAGLEAERDHYRTRQQAVPLATSEDDPMAMPHTDPSGCPTWNDWCHCTVDALECAYEELERVEAERDQWVVVARERRERAERAEAAGKRLTDERDYHKAEHQKHETAKWAVQAERDAATARAERAEANYQFMVDRACNEKLDGYRELGAESLANLERAERAEAEVKRLRDGIEVLARVHEVNGKVHDWQLLALLDHNPTRCAYAYDWSKPLDPKP